MNFLDLPVPLQHEIYDRLDIQHRTKLNISLPKVNRISQTLRTNPAKDKKLKYIAQLAKVKKYKSISDFSDACGRFIKENWHDPTIQELCGTLSHVIPIDYRSITEDITKNTVSATYAYCVDDVDTSDATSLISRCATSETFQNVMQNPTLVGMITPLFANVSEELKIRVHGFFFNLVCYSNASLLKHILSTRNAHITDEWCNCGLDYLENRATIFGSPFAIRTLCEIVRVSDATKKAMLVCAIERLDMDVADYLTSLGVSL